MILAGERGAAGLAAFASAGDVGRRAEVQVAAVQGGQFGGAEAGLGGQGQQGVVAAAGAG
jgi:hypothetical protein